MTTDALSTLRRRKLDITLPPLHHSQQLDRKSTRLNSSHLGISYAVFCLKKKKKTQNPQNTHQRCTVRNSDYKICITATNREEHLTPISHPKQHQTKTKPNHLRKTS